MPQDIHHDLIDHIGVRLQNHIGRVHPVLVLQEGPAERPGVHGHVQHISPMAADLVSSFAHLEHLNK